MLEEELKFEVDPGFAMPDLADLLPAGGRIAALPPISLRATYYDTADLRLCRCGASLRFRRGDHEPWTVKLPTMTVGIRDEISRGGSPGAIPEELVWLITAFTRGAPLAPESVLRTTRRVTELRDADDQLLAEVDDDLVAILDDGKRIRDKFREIEVERKEGTRKLLRKVGKRLQAAGAESGTFVAKYARARGCSGPAEPAPPVGQLSAEATAGEVVTEAIRAATARIFAHDPLVRLRQPLPDGDTAVHQMRVGCRRLRSDLRTFAPLLHPGWTAALRAELAWLAGILGGARDAEVLRDRLHRTAAADPLAPPDARALGRLDTVLAERHEQAMVELDRALRTDRYTTLLDQLVEAAAAPRLDPVRAAQPALDMLPRLVAKPWRKLAFGADGVNGCGELDPLAPDHEWHEVRIRAKRARYATEAVAPVLGEPAIDLGRAIAGVQGLLGEHQDAVVASETWLEIARSDPADHELAVTAGRLFERERTVVRTMRARFPDAWAATDLPRHTGWLP